MPVQLRKPLRCVSQQEFGEIAYAVMETVFDIHKEMGRFFDEKIYKHELARRLPGIELEFPLEVSFAPFHKSYFVDVLANGCAVFELKAVESLTERHRAQLLQYLLLCELSHGKLINVRPESVEHEFVNTTLSKRDRTSFHVAAAEWREYSEVGLRDWFIELLRDLGTCLDASLYEDAITDLCGGRECVERDIEIVSSGMNLGRQRFRLVHPAAAIKITTLNDNLTAFESHARRLLTHTQLEAIQWINVARHEVSFRTLRRGQ